MFKFLCISKMNWRKVWYSLDHPQFGLTGSVFGKNNKYLYGLVF